MFIQTPAVKIHGQPPESIGSGKGGKCTK